MGSAFIDKLATYRANPAAMNRAILNLAPEGLDSLPDPSNPFAFMAECIAQVGAAFMAQDEVLTRQQYPRLAQTENELYLHMSDVDYIGRFASPARVNPMTLVLSKAEILAKAVASDTVGVRKLIFPRYTKIGVGEYTFTLQYPIEIRVMANQAIQVVYDTSEPSPLESLATNIPNWRGMRIGEYDTIAIDLPLYEFTVNHKYEELNAASGFKHAWTFPDKFYYARVYRWVNNRWSEISTTHSEMVYDPMVPTALLRVTETTLAVEIPLVYISTGQVTDKVRVDIYTTRGPLDFSLADTPQTEFRIDFDGVSEATSAHTAPLSTFSVLFAYADAMVNGGSDSVSFEELRRRVINNAYGGSNLPITPAQLETQVTDRGFDIVKAIDSITNRIYYASRALPPPEEASHDTAMSATILTLTTSFSDMTDIESEGNVVVNDNGDRITILPTSLYRVDNGIPSIVPQSVVDGLMAMTVEARVAAIAEANFVYSPFHYVMDKNFNRFELRAYYLDSPEVNTREFLQENETTGLVMTTQAYSFDRVPEGYRLRFKTRSSTAAKELGDDQIEVQLSFVSPGEVEPAFLEGTYLGRDEAGERIFEFIIETNYDLDDNDRLTLTNFIAIDETPSDLPTLLTQDFNLYYIATGYSTDGMTRSDMDNDVAAFMLPAEYVALTRERMNMTLGHALKNLWVNGRSIVGSEDYERWAADVPWLYETVVYERDPVTGTIIIDVDPVTEEVSFRVLHEAGDPVLDNEGSPVMLHHEGDVKLNPDGSPIAIVGSRTMKRMLDMLFLDGRYYFVTSEDVIEYRTLIHNTLADWVVDDIADIATRVLENTHIAFYPKRTLGTVRVKTSDTESVLLNPEQSIEVTYYLEATAYNNTQYRTALINSTINTVARLLKGSFISKTDIETTLKTEGGDDIKAVEIKGIGGALDLVTARMQDASEGLALRKRLEVRADGTIDIVSDINISFVRQ